VVHFSGKARKMNHIPPFFASKASNTYVVTKKNKIILPSRCDNFSEKLSLCKMMTMKNQMPYYFRMFIALGYMVAGIISLTTPLAQQFLESKLYGMLLGILLFGYGLFRAYRNQKQWDVLNHEK
jgi:hypothetical protein